MAQPKLYGNKYSSATMRTLACLYEKEIDFEFVMVNLKEKEHNQEAHLARHPFGQVPAYEDGELSLFESRAINMYLSYKYADKGTPLKGKNPAEMAMVLVWMEVEGQKFDTPASKLMMELIFKPMVLKAPSDEAAVEENEAKLAKVLDVYEAKLAQTKYLAGHEFTLADLHHLPLVYLLHKSERITAVFDAREHVKAWAADMMARPAWVKVKEFINF